MKLVAKVGRVPLRALWRAFGVVTLVTIFDTAADSRAADFDAVPAELQAELLSKLASYDRRFAARAGDRARLLIVVKRDQPKSEVSAAQMKSALSRVERIGGLPHEDIVVAYEGAARLAERCKTEHVAAVYLTPGFEDDIADLRASLSGVSVISLAAVADYVPQGIVLGFEVEGGKPRILVNLAQARLQDVAFSSDVLHLMRVYR
jgi:hypothetical protein